MTTKQRNRQDNIINLLNDGKTLEYVGSLYNISRQRVEQISKASPIIKDEDITHETKEHKALYNRYFHSSKRAKAINLLGGVCSICGNSDFRCLQLDHINGGGSKDTRTPYSINKWIIDNTEEASKEFQVLCANCNWIKRFENQETVKRKY